MKLLITSQDAGAVGRGDMMADSQMATDLAGLGHEVSVLAHLGTPAVPGVRMEYCKAAAPPLREVLMRCAPDVVIASSWIATVGRVCSMGAWPVVVFDHGTAVAGMPDDVRRQFSGVIATTEHIASDARSRRCRVAVLHPPDIELDVGERSADVVLFPSGSVDKGIDVVAMVATRIGELRFAAVGGCNGQPDARHVVARCPNVAWLDGPLPPAELIRRARVLLSPTRREGYGQTLRLAARYGVPVVCTDLPGPREAVGVVARYVRLDNPEGWVQATLDAWHHGPRPGEVPAVDRAAEIQAVGAMLEAAAGAPVGLSPPVSVSVPAVVVSPPPPPPPPPVHRSARSRPPLHPGEKPRVALIADVPGWAFSQNMSDMAETLGGEFDFTLLFNKSYQRWPDLADFHLVYHTFHRVPLHAEERIPWNRALSSLRTQWFDSDHPGPPTPLDVDLVRRFKGFHVCNREVYDALRAAGCVVDYLTNPVRMGRFPRPTSHKDVICCFAGNAHRPDGDIKGLFNIIQPACAVTETRLLAAEYTATRLLPQHMPWFYSLASVYCCASVYEGASNSVLEAMAAGLLVVTTDCGNAREMYESQIEHFGKSGIFLAERDEAAFAEVLRSLHAMAPKDRAALGKLNRAEIRERWSWDVWADRYRAFFRKALA